LSSSNPYVNKVRKRKMVQYPDPSPHELNDPLFAAVWEAIKGWDLQDERREGYQGANGSHVVQILNHIRRVDSSEARAAFRLGGWAAVLELEEANATRDPST